MSNEILNSDICTDHSMIEMFTHQVYNIKIDK